MNEPAPASSPPIAALCTRLEHLARDPRAKFLPQLPAIALELRQALELVASLERRVAALELYQARTASLTQEDAFHDRP